MIKLLLCLILLPGCTTLHFRSKGQIPVYIGPTESHHLKRKIVGAVEFYMWGFIPRTHFVIVDEEIMDEGFVSAANVSTSEYQTWWDLFFSITSLGMYIPKHYQLEFYGMHGEYDE